MSEPDVPDPTGSPHAQGPMFCHPDAYEHLAAQASVIDTTRGLFHAAVAISMHALEGVEPARIEARASELAQRARSRLQSDQPQAIIARVHEVLFDEDGFSGNQSDYYNPRNSYLPWVLETRRGIPITLALLYKFVVEQVGLQVVGINAPGHFLAGVWVPEGTTRKLMIVDPFFAGRVLSRDEAIEMIVQATSVDVRDPEQVLTIATHQQWIHRMLLNLQMIYSERSPKDNLLAMLELRELLATFGQE